MRTASPGSLLQDRCYHRTLLNTINKPESRSTTGRATSRQKMAQKRPLEKCNNNTWSSFQPSFDRPEPPQDKTSPPIDHPCLLCWKMPLELGQKPIPLALSIVIANYWNCHRPSDHLQVPHKPDIYRSGQSMPASATRNTVARATKPSIAPPV